MKNNVKKFTAIEWQSFSLKKDIEIIVKWFQSNRIIQISLLCEIILVILGVALICIFEHIREQPFFWIILFGLSLIPILILLLKWCKNIYLERQYEYDKMNPREFIDTFDNEITYYTLIAESYCVMLDEALSDDSDHNIIVNDEIVYFYYIQASYYFQKAITGLVSINNIVIDVLSTNEKSILRKKLIALPRYKNISKLLSSIYNYLEKKYNAISILDSDKLISRLNKDRKELLEHLDITVNSVFSLQEEECSNNGCSPT